MKSIITLKAGQTINYFCTWATQNFVWESRDSDRGDGVFDGAQAAVGARDKMDYDNVFGDGGFAYLFSPDVRRELLLMLDDGWDVDYAIDPANNKAGFGSLELNSSRFPFKGNCAERLRQANETAKAAGWRGIGIWVAAQPCGNLYAEDFDAEALREYYTQRISDCKYAGVTYWKVDWGKYERDGRYRKLLTDLGHELYPELVIEHARPTAPINGDPNEGQTRFADDIELAELTGEFCSFSDVFRTYDITDDRLGAATTLDRVCYALRNAVGFINCEDELFIGAALGLTLGIMRSPYGKDKYEVCNRLDEIKAALKWQKTAPAFAGGEFAISETLLSDEWYFKDADTWFSPIRGKNVVQSAPFIVARNTSLPEVRKSEKSPYIVASRNPSGAYSLAAIPRYRYGKNTQAPQVTCDIADAQQIGLFGQFGLLRFKTLQIPRAVYAKCLYTGIEKDITEYVKFDGDAIEFSGKITESVSSPSDRSQSAVVITLVK